MWPWRVGVVVENDRCDSTDRPTARGALRLCVENLDVRNGVWIARPCCTRRQAVAGKVARRDARVLEADDIIGGW